LKSVRTTVFLFGVLIAAFLLLSVRCFYLQFFESEHYSSVWSKQRQQLRVQKPQRGAILDCRGRVLAASNKIQTIFADPQIIKSAERAASKLGRILNMEAIEIYRLITESKNRRFVKIKVGADANECGAAGKIYGIGVKSGWQRHYPMGRLTANIVGFTNVENEGKGGIELQYGKELKGSSGQEIFFADVRRRPIRPKEQPSVLADGAGIILTLDATIQQFARAELLRQYESYEAESAIAIAAEPETGAILALVSLPDFDPNNIAARDVNNLRNRAMSDQFEPGSVIKPIAVAIAIDAGVVERKEKIFCEYGNYRGRGFGRIGEYGEHRFGDLTLREILVHSSNIGMAKIGQKLGKEKLYKGLQFFGFGRKTGVDLPDEAEGLVRPVRQWTGYSVTRMPFGQEISVTGIQLVRAFCMLANGGRSVRPFLVKAIVNNNGEIVKVAPLEVRRRLLTGQDGTASDSPPKGVGFVVNPEVARWIVRDALVGVVNEGTGKKAKLEKWQVFGKTGTAQLSKKGERGYSADSYVASFAGGGPAEKPAVVVLVSIFKPNIQLGKGYTGGTIAAPVAAKIIEKTLNYLER